MKKARMIKRCSIIRLHSRFLFRCLITSLNFLNRTAMFITTIQIKRISIPKVLSFLLLTSSFLFRLTARTHINMIYLLILQMRQDKRVMFSVKKRNLHRFRQHFLTALLLKPITDGTTELPGLPV